MSLRDWFRPPRHLLPLFLLLTIIPSTLLIVLGWRSVEQDLALERQRSAERFQQAADLAVSTLTQSLSFSSQSLRVPDSVAGLVQSEDAVVVRFAPNAVEAFPSNRLAYYPVVSRRGEAQPDQFAEADAEEIVRGDYRGAARILHQFTQDSDPSVKARAFIRLARIQVKSGEPNSALDTYAQAAVLDQAVVTEVPVGLFARWARCALLEKLGRKSELSEEARLLHSFLLQGRYRLTRVAYELHLEDIRRWRGSSPDDDDGENSRRLALAVEWLWNEWKRNRVPNRSMLEAGGVHFTILAESSQGVLTILIAGPDFVQRQWLAKLAPLTSGQSIRVSVGGIAPPSSATGIRRTPAQTGLPWIIAFEDTAQQAETDRMAARRQFWLAGLCLLAALLISGTCFIARAMNRELAVARLQSDFVSSVSHEFRTPLTSLSQLTEILLERRITTEERRETYYQAMARQTERLRRLVESLLDFGRMEAGASPYHMELVDACALIRSVVEQFEQEAARNGYHVELELNGFAATIAADRDALTNVLWNLLDNAVKYSPQCRTVWVNVERGPKYLSIHVRDRGLGIPPAEQREVFRKFVRGAAAKQERIPGTGIGLAMVRHILSAHDGDIQLESQPGEGSTFTVLLPVEES